MRKELIMRTFNSEIEVNDIDDAIPFSAEFRI